MWGLMAGFRLPPMGQPNLGFDSALEYLSSHCRTDAQHSLGVPAASAEI